MINKRLDEVRELVGLTKKKYASELGITAQAYNNYYKGDRDIPTELALRVNQLFNISLDWLLTGKGKMYIQDSTSLQVIGDNNITVGSAVNGNISINTSKFNHKEDILEIIELLEYAPSGFLSMLKEKLLAFKKLSEF